VKISVVIPTRNSASHIAKIITMLKAQTIPKDIFEIIVVDNASVDDTVNVVEELTTKTDNITLVSEPLIGRAHARNRGIDISKGEIVLFLDDDIEIDVDHLKAHLDLHDKPNRPLAVIPKVIDVSRISPKWLKDYLHERQSIGSKGPDKFDKNDISMGFHFVTGNVSISRATLDRVLTQKEGETYYFDKYLIYRQDAELGFRLIKSGAQFIFADHIVCYHNHPRNLLAIIKRSYNIGRSTVILINKHPEIAPHIKYIRIPPLINVLGFSVCLILFVPTFLLRYLWVEPFYKIISAILITITNFGYWRGLNMGKRNI